MVGFAPLFAGMLGRSRITNLGVWVAKNGQLWTWETAIWRLRRLLAAVLNGTARTMGQKFKNRPKTSNSIFATEKFKQFETFFESSVQSAGFLELLLIWRFWTIYGFPAYCAARRLATTTETEQRLLLQQSAVQCFADFNDRAGYSNSWAKRFKQ